MIAVVRVAGRAGVAAPVWPPLCLLSGLLRPPVLTIRNVVEYLKLLMLMEECASVTW